MKAFLSILLILVSILILSCDCEEQDDRGTTDMDNRPLGNFECDPNRPTDEMQAGCDGQIYPHPDSSLYVIPFLPGTTFKLGLSNCSSSFHRSGQPDQYAFDFDFPTGTPFYASRAGTVVKVVENQSSDGGGAGNYVVIDHGDNTFGLYYHSPQNGIEVKRGDVVERGDLLGSIGRSGLAGYAHLHLIFTQGGYDYPYDAIPVSFTNVVPPEVILQSGGTYRACQW